MIYVVSARRLFSSAAEKETMDADAETTDSGFTSVEVSGTPSSSSTTIGCVDSRALSRISFGSVSAAGVVDPSTFPISRRCRRALAAPPAIFEKSRAELGIVVADVNDGDCTSGDDKGDPKAECRRGEVAE